MPPSLVLPQTRAFTPVQPALRSPEGGPIAPADCRAGCSSEQAGAGKTKAGPALPEATTRMTLCLTLRGLHRGKTARLLSHHLASSSIRASFSPSTLSLGRTADLDETPAQRVLHRRSPGRFPLAFFLLLRSLAHERRPCRCPTSHPVRPSTRIQSASLLRSAPSTPSRRTTSSSPARSPAQSPSGARRCRPCLWRQPPHQHRPRRRGARETMGPR